MKELFIGVVIIISFLYILLDVAVFRNLKKDDPDLFQILGMPGFFTRILSVGSYGALFFREISKALK